MKKILSLIMTVVLIAAMFVSCASNNDTAVVSSKTESVAPTSYDVNIAALAGPTGMGMAFMLNSDDTINNYNYTIAASPDEVTSKLLTGTYDIAALPTNVAATLYNGSQGKIKLLALNTLGVLYILEKGDSIKNIKDLKGKTVYVSGQGSTPEYVLRYLLEENGLNPNKDVKLDFTYTAHADLVAYAASGKADVVVLPEPTVTALLAQNSDMRVAIDLNEAWADVVADDDDDEDSIISMGCVAVRTEFAQKNPEAVKNFLKDYEASVNKVNSDYAAASEKIAELGIVAKSAVALKALPRCNIVFVSGRKMESQIEDFYELLFEANPKSIGGKLPDDEFYYIG